MNLENWFACPIWNDRIDLDWYVIAEHCLEMEKKASDIVNSNAGGWHSPYLSLSQDKFFAPLFNAIQEKLDLVSAQVDPKFKVKIDNIWIIVNREGDYNVKHYHPNTALSGVVYVACDENSGNISFLRPDLKEHYPIKTYQSSLFTDSVYFTPEIGKLIIFPAWLCHQVQPSKSSAPRIAIAFNAHQVYN
jgi:uncharacterized protein (TIGR02466 family)